MEDLQDELGLGLSGGFKFKPDDEELVEYYLLRRILGQQLPLEVVISDDPLSAPPWELLRTHKRTDEGFFFANGQTKHGTGNRTNRTCVGGGWWAGQKRVLGGDRLHVHDTSTEITWKKYMLNFHLHDEDGSTGWVMHEYSITAPHDLASSPLRLYRIRFSGHGQNCKKEPYDYSGEKQPRAEPDLLQEHISAANSVFPVVAVVDHADDEDSGSARPHETPYTDLDQRYPGWTQLDSFQDLAMPDSSFFPGAGVGHYAGPGAPTSHQYFPDGNMMNLGTHIATPSSDQGAPGVMNEYDGAAPPAGMLPFGQGSLPSVFVESFMDFELQDMDFNIDGQYLDFPDPYASEAPLHG